MKIKKFKISPRPIHILFSVILLSLTFSINVFAQKSSLKRVRYISSAPKKVSETKRPTIRFVKSNKSDSESRKKVRVDAFDLEKKAFDLINEQRSEKGLSPLTWNEKVAGLARKHSENMAAYNFFSHTGKNGRMVDQRAIDFGLDKWKSIGENIAYNKGFDNPAEFAVERWMLSKGHRMNLLHSNWKESGIGIAVTEDGMYFFTQIFIVE